MTVNDLSAHIAAMPSAIRVIYKDDVRVLCNDDVYEWFGEFAEYEVLDFEINKTLNSYVLIIKLGEKNKNMITIETLRDLRFHLFLLPDVVQLYNCSTKQWKTLWDEDVSEFFEKCENTKVVSFQFGKITNRYILDISVEGIED